MSDRVVAIAAGKVEGVALPGLRCWRGVPYARAGRFEAPLPVAPWTGVRPAQAFGKQCPQLMGGKIKPGQFDSETHGEDCLHLNIYVPDGGSPGPKPVMVWIHGGAFMAGSGDPYDGSALAREGDVVVVTINYRLGVLGFVNFGEALGLPQIPGNLGLRDQIAALEWVRDNIAAFGGDPGRVTIAGQSAGSLSVSLLMLAPAARGLFHGGIAQSGAVSLIHDRARSVQDASAFAAVLGLDQGSFERLRTMPLEDLFRAQARVGHEIGSGIPAAPWFDGDLLPATLAEAQRHAAAPVPLIAGATRDEIVLFSFTPGDVLPSTWDELEALLFAQLPRDHAERVLAAYPRSRKGRIALASDLTFLMPTRHFAERHAAIAPTWAYRFDYSHLVAGATHGLDLTLAWPFSGLKMALARGGPNLGWRQMLGERMRADIAHFVRTGEAPADWPRYDAAARQVKVYDREDRIEAGPEAARVAAWAGRDVSPGVAR